MRVRYLVYIFIGEKRWDSECIEKEMCQNHMEGDLDKDNVVATDVVEYEKGGGYDEPLVKEMAEVLSFVTVRRDRGYCQFFFLYCTLRCLMKRC